MSDAFDGVLVGEQMGGALHFRGIVERGLSCGGCPRATSGSEVLAATSVARVCERISATP